jgi:hypothetical protein
MPPQLTRLLVFVLVVCAPLSVQASDCNQLFAGQQPPSLLNAKLGQRTTGRIENFAALESNTEMPAVRCKIQEIHTISLAISGYPAGGIT